MRAKWGSAILGAALAAAVLVASPAQAAQVALPDADVSNGGNWSEGVSAADGDTALWNEIDDSAGDDSSTFDKTTDMFQADANRAFVVSLGSVSDPNSSLGHTVVVRARKNQSGGINLNLSITLQRPDGTAIASFTTPTLNEIWTDYTYTLTGAEADSIASDDYSNLRAKVVVDASAGATNNGRHPQLTSLGLELPDGGVGSIPDLPTSTTPAPIAVVNGQEIAISVGSIIGQGVPVDGACALTQPVEVGVNMADGSTPYEVTWHFDQLCQAVVGDITANPVEGTDPQDITVPENTDLDGSIELDLVDTPGDGPGAAHKHRGWVKFTVQEHAGITATEVKKWIKYYKTGRMCTPATMPGATATTAIFPVGKSLTAAENQIPMGCQTI